jgi:hypothetical protein
MSLSQYIQFWYAELRQLTQKEKTSKENEENKHIMFEINTRSLELTPIFNGNGARQIERRKPSAIPRLNKKISSTSWTIITETLVQ